MATVQRQMTETTTAKDQCHLDSADRISELNGQLSAKDVLISKCQDSSVEASFARAKLNNAQDQIRILEERSASELANLRKGMQSEIDMAKHESSELEKELTSKTKLVEHLKREFVEMGERFGKQLGDLDNKIIDSEEGRRKVVSERNKIKEELESLQRDSDQDTQELKVLARELDDALRSEKSEHYTTKALLRQGDKELAQYKSEAKNLEIKLKEEEKAHGQTIQNHAKTQIKLDQFETGIRRFLEGEEADGAANMQNLRRLLE